jgi:hypothetical protein
MVPNINAYNTINESITLKELSKGNERNLSYGDMKKGFLSKGYEFLGNISLKVLTYNCFSYEEIIDVVPDELVSKLSECGSRKYIRTVPEKKYINTNTFGRDYNLDNALKIISEPNIEKVKSCFSKKGDLYYVLWNNDKKYFYFMTIDESGPCNNNDAVAFLELFIKIKTSGIDTVNDEVDELYAQYLDEKAKREEAERQRKEEERIQKEKDDAYQARVDAIRVDAEENPDNYVEVKRENLPQSILDALNSDDYMDREYAVYTKHISTDPYDNETVMCYVNDDELAHGYKFKQVISHARPGTYWGD